MGRDGHPTPLDDGERGFVALVMAGVAGLVDAAGFGMMWRTLHTVLKK